MGEQIKFTNDPNLYKEIRMVTSDNAIIIILSSIISSNIWFRKMDRFIESIQPPNKYIFREKL